MNIKQIEALILSHDWPYAAAAAMEWDYFHPKDVRLRAFHLQAEMPKYDPPTDLLGAIENLGRVASALVKVRIEYSGVPLGAFLGAHIWSMDDLFGAVVPVPKDGEICPIAWAVARGISMQEAFDGYTGDLGLAPTNRVTTWETHGRQ